MKNQFRLLSILAGGLLASALLNATPLPLPVSALGNHESIYVASHPYNLGGGGVFEGTVAGNDVYLWCVDVENFINPPQSYYGDVVALDPWTGGKNQYVQKGEKNSTTNWLLQQPDGATGMTPLQRYQVAAYLIEQTSFFGGVPNASSDYNFELAIWRILDLSTSPNGPGLTAAAQTYLNTAVAYVEGHSNFGFGDWAVVSGVAGRDGTLDCDVRTQTFLVELGHAVPEPASCLLMGGGLIGLWLLRRRKA